MIIKDFYVKYDLEQIVIDDIIKFLIKNKINYLYIKETNELHFDNYILRFKKSKNIFDLIYDDFFKILNNITNNYSDLLDYDNYVIEDNFYKKNNFKDIKKINNMKVDTRGKVKKLNKKFTPTRKIFK